MSTARWRRIAKVFPVESNDRCTEVDEMDSSEAAIGGGTFEMRRGVNFRFSDINREKQYIVTSIKHSNKTIIEWWTRWIPA